MQGSLAATATQEDQKVHEIGSSLWQKSISELDRLHLGNSYWIENVESILWTELPTGITYRYMHVLKSYYYQSRESYINSYPKVKLSIDGSYSLVHIHCSLFERTSLSLIMHILSNSLKAFCVHLCAHFKFPVLLSLIIGNYQTPGTVSACQDKLAGCEWDWFYSNGKIEPSTRRSPRTVSLFSLIWEFPLHLNHFDVVIGM